MSSEDNRIITQFMDVLQTRRYDDLLPLATQGATWWVAGPQDTLPFCGSHLLSDRAAQMKESFGKASSVSYEIRHIISEGNTVVLESVTRAEGPISGQVYENDILTTFTLVDGKIQSIREYLDTTQILKYMGAA